MVPGLNTLFLSTVGVWHHILYEVVYWEDQLIFWQAGCLTAHPVPCSEFTQVLDNWAKLSCWMHPPPAQLKLTLNAGVLLAEASHPSQSHAGWFALLSHLSQPLHPRYDTWLWTTALLICPPKVLPSVFPPSFTFLCRKLCISQRVDIQCGAMLNCLLWRRSPPRGTSASASYHVLVSRRLSNSN